MAKKVLITGATGFAGSFLAELLQDRARVTGTYFSQQSRENLKSVLTEVSLVKLDLRDKKAVFKLIEIVRPGEVYHLAALSSPAASFDDPGGVYVNNVVCQINLFEAVRKLSKKPKVLVIGSADEYGLVKKEDVPIDEAVSLNPTNPYSVSKVAQDFLGRQYYLAYKLPIVRVRPFNHIGPRQERGFVVADFAYQIARIEEGKQKPEIKVGNLSAIRDFTDVRDMVAAYELALAKGKVGEVYNIGSGSGYKIGEILDTLLTLAKVKIKVVVDKKRFRPADNPVIICEARKFRRQTGWKARVKIKKTLADVLNYWRCQV